VIVNGPRQAGKTTLLELFHQDVGGTMRSLDDADMRRSADLDPVTFADQKPRPLIIDEVQRGGNDLILAIKRAVDTNRSRGQYVLSGSSRFLTIPTLTESLAGRTVFIELWPFSAAERFGAAPDFIDQIFTEPGRLVGSESSWSRRDYLGLIVGGSFPEVASLTSPLARRAWYDAYVETVAMKDVQEFAQVQRITDLPRMLELIAARSGSSLVLSDLAASLGITHNTIRTYLSYLETVFIVDELTAWSTNLTSRVTKSPKAFLTDSGLAAHFLQMSVDDLASVGNRALRGLVETFAFSELLKMRALTTRGFRLYHYRDRDGREIDFICEGPGGGIVAIEIKASASPRSSDTQHLAWLRDKLGARFVAGIVLYLGNHGLSLGDRLYLLPMSALWDHRTG
jgi:predicted AAA+ superfamily ATPase